MATYTVTGVDPAFRLPGVPNDVRNVSGAAEALSAVEELEAKGRVEIVVIEHDRGPVEISALRKAAGGASR